MKKILALILTLTMVVGLAASAMAATITINVPTTEAAPTEEVTYTIYKVFNATVDATDATKVSYTLCEGDTLSADMIAAGFSVDTAGNVSFDEEKSMDANGTPTDAAIKAIAGYVTNADIVGTVVVAAGTTSGTSENLAPGYYYITTTTGTAVIINTNNENITVNDKNVIPKVVKSPGTEYDENSKKAIAAVGTDQPYTAVITKTHGAKSVVFTDTMTNQTYNGDVTVTVGGAEVAPGETTYTVSGAKGDSTFTITFADAYIASLADNTEITLNYSAKITSDALSTNPATNTAKISSGNGNEVSSETIEVFNAKISVNKVDGNQQPLAGAKFKLKNSEGKYYAGSTADGTANWTDEGIEVEAVAQTVTDTETGETITTYVAEFKGLGAGTYTLEESTVPAGYNKADDQTITVTADGFTAANLEQTKEVVNQSGTVLPSTGGIGTTIFYIVGGLLAVGAGVVLVTKKRMSKEDI